MAFVHMVFLNILISNSFDCPQPPYSKDYFLAKAKLFTGLNKKTSAVINIDDEYGKRLIAMAQGKVTTFGLQNKADVTAENVRLSFSGSTFSLKHSDGAIEVKTKLIGVENLDSTHVKVVTENTVVYLMGLVKKAEAELAATAAADVAGIERVVKLFEYLD